MNLHFLRARVRFFPANRGGRPQVPVGDGYAPYLRTKVLQEDMPVRIYGMPPDGKFDTDYDIEVELSYHPRLDYFPLIKDTKFDLVEGSRVIGEGIVTSLKYERAVR